MSGIAFANHSLLFEVNANQGYNTTPLIDLYVALMKRSGIKVSFWTLWILNNEIKWVNLDSALLHQGLIQVYNDFCSI